MSMHSGHKPGEIVTVLCFSTHVHTMRLTCHSVQQFTLMNQGHMNQESFHAVTYSPHTVYPALKMEHWKDILQSHVIY